MTLAEADTVTASVTAATPKVTSSVSTWARPRTMSRFSDAKPASSISTVVGAWSEIGNREITSSLGHHDPEWLPSEWT